MARKLEPRALMPLVNAAMAHARAGDNKKAEGMLVHALRLDPHSAAANFNLGLLKAEMGDKAQAEKYLRASLKADPHMAQAAYNLGLLLHQKNPNQAMALILKAYETSPNPRYAFTLAYYMNQAGNPAAAEKMLAHSLRQWPWHADFYLLLADMHLADKQDDKARKVLEAALAGGHLAPMDRRRLAGKLKSLKSRTRP